MSFDFHNAPTEGQTHSPGAGVSYIFSSGAWRMVAGPGATYTGAASDTPPPNPAPNTLWWESDTGRLFIYYADVDTGQWVQISGPVKENSGSVRISSGGSGVTLLPTLSVATEAKRAGLSTRALDSAAAHRTIALVWRKRSSRRMARCTSSASTPTSL